MLELGRMALQRGAKQLPAMSAHGQAGTSRGAEAMALGEEAVGSVS
jgi:hypothetical protein